MIRDKSGLHGAAHGGCMTSEALGYHDEAKELVDALELEHGFY